MNPARFQVNRLKISVFSPRAAAAAAPAEAAGVGRGVERAQRLSAHTSRHVSSGAGVLHAGGVLIVLRWTFSHLHQFGAHELRTQLSVHRNAFTQARAASVQHINTCHA